LSYSDILLDLLVHFWAANIASAAAFSFLPLRLSTVPPSSSSEIICGSYSSINILFTPSSPFSLTAHVSWTANTPATCKKGLSETAAVEA
jgi:hypothetical protein